MLADVAALADSLTEEVDDAFVDLDESPQPDSDTHSTATTIGAATVGMILDTEGAFPRFGLEA